MMKRKDEAKVIKVKRYKNRMKSADKAPYLMRVVSNGEVHLDDILQDVAKENGFSFVGAHPMAGVERSGFTYSTAEMFDGATLIVTPYTGEDIGMTNALSMFFCVAVTA